MALRMPLGKLHERQGEPPADLYDWSGSGRVDGPEVKFRSARFRDVSATLSLKSGRLNIADLAANFDGHPLAGEGSFDLAAPHAFRASVDVSGLPLDNLLALASSTAANGRLSGTVAGRGEASGTLMPWHVEGRGRATIEHAQAGQVVIGDVPIEWETRGENVVVTAREFERYGGRISAVATIPVRGTRPVEGTVTLSHVDTAQLSVAVPGWLRLTGRADGCARFQIPINDDFSQAEGEATLTAAKMTVDGIPATSLRATIAVHDGVPNFGAHAEGLEGTFVVKGAGRSGQNSNEFAINADVSAIGVQLASLIDALGMSSGPLDGFKGLGAAAVRVTTTGSEASTHAEGSAEVHDLRWGEKVELGHVSAGIVVAPGYWRFGELSGSLWESPIQGEFWRRSDGHEPVHYGLNFQLERLSLARIFAFEPELGRRFEGFASFTAEGHWRSHSVVRASSGSGGGVFIGCRLPGFRSRSNGMSLRRKAFRESSRSAKPSLMWPVDDFTAMPRFTSAPRATFMPS